MAYAPPDAHRIPDHLGDIPNEPDDRDEGHRSHVLPRRESGQPGPEIRLLRSPRGCILQAAARAVSVSWFPPPDHGAALGELQVIVWRGVVTRPGSANRATSEAVALQETLLEPDGVGDEAWVWRTADGAVWETGALAARCHALAADAAAVDPAAPTHAL